MLLMLYPPELAQHPHIKETIITSLLIIHSIKILKYICNFLSILKLVIVSVKHFCVPRQILNVFLMFISFNFHYFQLCVADSCAHY